MQGVLKKTLSKTHAAHSAQHLNITYQGNIMDITKVTEFGKTAFDMASHAHTIMSLVNIGGGDEPTDPKEKGSQSKSSGKGKTDESLFFAAIGLAVVELKKLSAYKKVGVAEKAIANVIDAITELEDPIRRKEIILTIGWKESVVKDEIEQGKDKDGKDKPPKIVERYQNINGAEALVFLAKLGDKEEIKKHLRMFPTSGDIFRARLKQIDDTLLPFVNQLTRWIEADEKSMTPGERKRREKQQEDFDNILEDESSRGFLASIFKW